MWPHIKLDRLHQAAQGTELVDGEIDHLMSCEKCQELLIFFTEHIQILSSPETKAA
jgi:hypothetical protein